MVKQLLIAAVLVSACGGGKKADTTPTDTSDGDQAAADQQQDSAEANMVPPEKMEEIVRMLDRKERIMARCLADAVDAKELPKNSRGKITLEIVISPSGSPDQIKVLTSTLESEKLKECVIGHIKTIQFPTLPKPFPTSHTYRFEAN
ncbi:MAG: AgmX/PglI C-terminal domain-containing protein [Deltaproteobacteria bacterium]|nr:AgmX/PglI C-terminal domain-containing protein [Deltaproteobacteria bacterium]